MTDWTTIALDIQREFKKNQHLSPYHQEKAQGLGYQVYNCQEILDILQKSEDEVPICKLPFALDSSRLAQSVTDKSKFDLVDSDRKYYVKCYKDENTQWFKSTAPCDGGELWFGTVFEQGVLVRCVD